MSDRRFSSVPSRPRAVAWALAAVVAGVVVGELAALLIFAGSSDRRIDEDAIRTADAAPAVVAAQGELTRARQARSALDDAVAAAGRARDEALVVARCEFSAAPQCPQTHITGVPGAGPEHRTADEFLADAQSELDRAEAERDRLAPSLDATVANDERAVVQARDAAIAGADRGFGARWLAMNAHTLASPGATVLRAALSGVFVLLFLLPLIVRLSRAKTTEDRRSAALVERDRAVFVADTVIAVKRAEVRAAIETLHAEHQLASARLAVETQAEIDREEQRRRVVTALEAHDPVLELPAAPVEEPVEERADRLPAVHEPQPGRRLPVVPDVAEAAVRWMRPFVPPIVATAIDTTTRPFRAVREVFEETEEIHFSLRRSHRVSVAVEETGESAERRVETAHAEAVVDVTPTAIEGRRQLPSPDA